jgi:predicted ester cyclase
MFPNAPGGPVEVKTIFDMFHAAFAGFEVEILDQLAEDDKVMTYKVFTGTHTGDFMGIAPTGQPVRVEVMDIVRITDGQIVEHRGLVDQLACWTAPDPDTPSATSCHAACRARGKQPSRE